MEVHINGKKINYDDNFEANTVQSKPDLIYDLQAGKYYTLLVIDPDAPSRANPKYKHWLHWLKVNIIKNINSGIEIVGYNPPTPPAGTGYHRYYICLLEQKEGIITDSVVDKIRKLTSQRSNFDPVKFEKDFGLKFVQKFKFNARN